MKKVCCLFLVCLLLTSCSASPATAPATVPYTFGDGQTAPATQAGTLPVTQPETEEPPADPCTHSNKTYSYVDDSTCLRDCPFCGELALEHELTKTYGLAGCLRVFTCFRCSHEIGEHWFEHIFPKSYAMKDGEYHGKYCSMENCAEWSDLTPHTFEASPYTRDGKTFTYCPTCKAYFQTQEEAVAPPAVCEKHRVSDWVHFSWYNGQSTSLFPCKNCQQFFTNEERLAMKS